MFIDQANSVQRWFGKRDCSTVTNLLNSLMSMDVSVRLENPTV